jgi:hypothetical protein
MLINFRSTLLNEQEDIYEFLQTEFSGYAKLDLKFTSDNIPYFVYRLAVVESHSLDVFLNLPDGNVDYSKMSNMVSHRLEYVLAKPNGFNLISERFCGTDKVYLIEHTDSKERFLIFPDKSCALQRIDQARFKRLRTRADYQHLINSWTEHRSRFSGNQEIYHVNGVDYIDPLDSSNGDQ